MSGKPVTNLADSVRQRLLNLSRKRQEDFNYLLNRFALERFLYRLSESPYADSFIVKGAYLFLMWRTALHRPTKDIDLLSLGERRAENLVRIFQEICDIPCMDGLVFRKDSVIAEAIRENQTLWRHQDCAGRNADRCAISDSV